jgi:AraC-like DNA-binding protein
MSFQDIAGWQKLVSLLDRGLRVRPNAVYHVRVPSSWGFKPKRNDDHHVICVKSGVGHYDVRDDDGNSRRIPLRRGALIYVGPGVEHCSYAEPTDPPFITPVRFSLVDEQGREANDLVGRLVYMSGADVLMSVFEHLFLELFHRWSRLAPDRDARCGMLLKSILFAAHNEFARSDVIDPAFESMRAYISEHLYRRIELDELSMTFGFSIRQLTRIFQTNVGLSPRRFITDERCRLAAMLLRDTNKNVKQVAYELGYPDQFSFSKQFKRVMGYPPTHCFERPAERPRRRV